MYSSPPDFLADFVASAFHHTRERRRSRTLSARDMRARAAAAEAALDDPTFAADDVLVRARVIAAKLETAGTESDERALRDIATHAYGDHLVAQMRRRDGPFRPLGGEVAELRLFLVGVTNLQDDEHDRVVVGVLGSPPDKADEYQIAQMWSLARGEEGWLLAAVEHYQSGRRHFDEPLVASPWHAADVADRATLQLAGDDAAAAAAAELVYRDTEGLTAVRDLALADARWSPDVLMAAVRRLIDAWEHAAADGTRAFAGVAGDHAALALVHPRGGSSRVEVRGAALERLEVVELLAEREPPAVRLILGLRGRHALVNVGGEVARVGSLQRDRDFEERWLLEQTSEPDRPWHLAHAEPLGWQHRDKRAAWRRRRAAKAARQRAAGQT